MKDSTFKKYCLVVDEWFVNGFNGTKAYQKFYPDSDYESADASFRKILENTRILEYKETKEKEKANEHNITLSKQIKRLQLIIDTSEKDSDVINALKEQSKLVGLYEKHNQQKTMDSTLVIKEVDLTGLRNRVKK